ncbi:MAG TPA: thiamine-phosphate kinase [Xanthobacteraceae bacterium]|nr:thiamine-phosphate kinase [Xanthobacteraceae bacterium]
MDQKASILSGEDRLIDRFFRPLVKDAGALGLFDDAACITPPAGHDIVLTVDASIAGVHFFADDPADLVAKKSLRVNLSDLAAKGARPLGALLSLSIPETVSEDWLAAFSHGLGADLDQFGCPLLGGDTTRTTGGTTISITAIGTVPRGSMVKRSGARPGEHVVVTGTLGDSSLGLELRKRPDAPGFAQLGDDEKAHLAERYLLPQPRLALADALREAATAAIDISDGLVGDLAKLASASGVAAHIEAKSVPLSPAARVVLAGAPERLETVLTGGDDYEIAAAVPENRLAALKEAAKEAGVMVTTIGRIETGDSVTVRGPNGQPLTLKRASFSHF